MANCPVSKINGNDCNVAATLLQCPCEIWYDSRYSFGGDGKKANGLCLKVWGGYGCRNDTLDAEGKYMAQGSTCYHKDTLVMVMSSDG
jgi:hypothetical protein